MNRYEWTDLKRSVRTSWLVVAVLTLSFLGPLIASLLRSSVEGFLSENSRRVLTADIAVTAYRPIRDDEVQRLDAKFGITKKVREIEFVTMTVGREDRTALVEVHAVESEFPIDGEFEFSDGTKQRRAPVGGVVWLSSDALLALDLAIGDKVRFGKSEFIIERSIKLAPGVRRAAFGFAPRAYIPIEAASATGLLGFGSQIYHRVYLETKKPIVSTEDVRLALGDPDLFLRTPEDSVQGLERVTRFVSLYLAVVSVSLFALGWGAAFYIIRTQALQRMRAAAVALVFGASTRAALRFEFFRIAVLTLIAALFAFVAAYLAARIIEPYVAEVLSKSVAGVFHVSVSWPDLLALGATALISALIFTVPFASRLHSARLVELFKDSPLGAGEASSFETGEASKPGHEPFSLLKYSSWITGVAAVISFAGLAMWLTRDAKLGLQLSLGFVCAILVIHGSGLLAFRALSRAFSQARGRFGSLLRLAGTQLARARFAVRLSFLAIGLTTFVASSVGQIMVSLGDELRNGAKLETAPDFFLFNIPESQLEDLQALLLEEKTRLDFVSPMILARLQGANGIPTENERFLKFPLRITWREKPIASERIVAGEDLPEKFDPTTTSLPKISMEARFAGRENFKIGDRLSFDVQGVPIEGEIANLRSVRWTDFNPNFFISFQGGVLEDAPKTWLGNVRVHERSERARVQGRIVREFPDLSVIDVSQTLERLIGLMNAILGPAEQAAWLAALFSVFVLLTIVAHSTRLRAQEMNLFRILGAEPRRVNSLYRIEFGLAASLGSIVGGCGGVLLAWLVSVKFLELEFGFDLTRLLITIGAGLVLGLGIGEWLYSRVARGLGIAARIM